MKNKSKLLKIAGIVVGVAALIVLGIPILLIGFESISGYYKGYGVNRDVFKENLDPCQKELRTDQNEFETLVYSSKDCKNYIILDHLSENPSKKIKYYSSLLNTIKQGNLELVMDSVKIVYTAPDGKVIPYREAQNGAYGYSQTYDYTVVTSEKINEYVYFEIIDNGKRIKVEKTFPLELGNSTSKLLLMMSQ